MFPNLTADTRRLRLNRTTRFPWYVLEALLFDNGYQAVVFYRMASACKRAGVPILPALLARWGLFLTGADIAPGASIGPGLIISHGTGLVVGSHTRIGARAILLHQVTLGAPDAQRLEDMPDVGDDVTIGAGASLIGRIQVGDRAVIGTNTTITEDVEHDTRVISEARKRVLRRSTYRAEDGPAIPSEASDGDEPG